MRIPDPDAKFLARFHWVMMIFWFALSVPSLAWWRQSVLLVLICSLYANFVGHFSGWDAARAEANTPSREEFLRLERLVLELHKKLMGEV